MNAVVDCPVSNWPRGTELCRHQQGGNQYKAGRDFWPEQGEKPGNNQQNIIRQHQQDTCWMLSPSICNCADWKARCTVLLSSRYSSWWWLPWVPTPANPDVFHVPMPGYSQTGTKSSSNQKELLMGSNGMGPYFCHIDCQMGTKRVQAIVLCRLVQSLPSTVGNAALSASAMSTK